MFLSAWSLALTISGIMVLLLTGIAARTAVRVLLYWDPASDTNRQISLESETWLASTLVAYGLGFQIITLFLFVLAADSFCEVIVGAMCATGALLANDFGLPTLILKMAGVFLYGFWLVLHKLDISVESYPLVRAKYIYLLLLLPLLAADITLQTLYIAGLKPDIITSCCAVVFNPAAGGGPNLLAGFGQGRLLPLFYGSVLLLLILGSGYLIRGGRLLCLLLAAGWLWFFGLGLLTLIVIFSSYIYAMPYHNCPFCLLKPEYNYIGFALYGTLIPAAFFGLAPTVAETVKRRDDLAPTAGNFQKLSVRLSLVLLLVFTGLASFHYVVYHLAGGQT